MPRIVQLVLVSTAQGYFMSIFRLFCSIVLIAFAPSAFAEESAQPQFGTVGGRCLTLFIGTQDFSKLCEEQLGRSLQPDGRTGVYFFVGSTHIITFSGRSKEDRTRDQTKLDSIAVDELVLNDGQGGKAGPQHISAKGTCDTAQETDKLYLVSCRGTLEKGTTFSASFQIDTSL